MTTTLSDMPSGHATCLTEKSNIRKFPNMKLHFFSEELRLYIFANPPKIFSSCYCLFKINIIKILFKINIYQDKCLFQNKLNNMKVMVNLANLSLLIKYIVYLRAFKVADIKSVMRIN